MNNINVTNSILDSARDISKNNLTAVNGGFDNIIIRIIHSKCINTIQDGRCIRCIASFIIF